jgi:predicted negative regulator of RcsB-dependent stress response
LSQHYQHSDQQGKNAFKVFLTAELYLRQQKISEAGEQLSYFIDTYPDVDLIPLITLRRALILLRLDQPELALKTAQAIEQTSLSDRSIILSGQIYEQVYNDKERALEYFLRIINEYPLSIFFEPIRYHIRQLKHIES